MSATSNPPPSAPGGDASSSGAGAGAHGPRLAAGTVFLHEGGIPLVRLSSGPGAGRWTLAAGFVRRSESPQAAAVREALERTGLRVAPLGILEAYAHGEDAVLVAYAADVLGGQLRPAAGGLEVRAFPPEELPWSEFGFDSARQALRDYVRRYFPRVRIPR